MSDFIEELKEVLKFGVIIAVGIIPIVIGIALAACVVIMIYK